MSNSVYNLTKDVNGLGILYFHKSQAIAAAEKLLHNDGLGFPMECITVDEISDDFTQVVAYMTLPDGSTFGPKYEYIKTEKIMG